MKEEILSASYLAIMSSIIISLGCNYFVLLSKIEKKIRKGYLATGMVLAFSVVFAFPVIQYHLQNNGERMQILTPDPVTRAEYFQSFALGFSFTHSLLFSLLSYWVSVIGNGIRDLMNGNRPRTIRVFDKKTNRFGIKIMNRRATDVFHLHYLAGIALGIISFRMLPFLDPALEFSEPQLYSLGRIWVITALIWLIAIIIASSIKGPPRNPRLFRKWHLFGWMIFDLLGIIIIMGSCHY